MRLFNFSAGPAFLPDEVISTARDALWCYRESGMGVMEMSHRGEEFEAIRSEAEGALRRLLAIPSSYAVIFATGGATNQFSMVPLNLLTPHTEGNYLVTGFWAEKAADEAARLGTVHIGANTKGANFAALPSRFSLSKNPAYLHYTSNNTIVGTQFRSEPAVPDGVPLVCDASSDILSRYIDITKYGLLYAAAQKNLGPAGVTVVIVRRDLLGRAPENLPILMCYRTHVESNSLYNTPPTFPIFAVGEVLKWVERQGGVRATEARNRQKAQLLYDEIDRNDFYIGHAVPEDRSTMNVVFRLRRSELEPVFVEEAKSEGMLGLKGHKLLGGIRVSIYNAFPLAGVARLVDFMRTFSAKHG